MLAAISAGPGATDKPALANETKMAYPFVRMDLTKGFCVCRQGQKPATGPLHCQNLRRGKRQSVRVAATSAESSGAPETAFVEITIPPVSPACEASPGTTWRAERDLAT
jgi:hypothetical protein